MKELPQQVSESVRLRNPQLYGMTVVSGVAPTGEIINVVTKPHKRIRQSTKPFMNKLEGEWFEHLKVTYMGRRIQAQSIRFKLGNGVWYKPDFVSFDANTCWEVKGPFAHRGGFENLKIAAGMYPEFMWHLVWKENSKWQEQVVLP